MMQLPWWGWTLLSVGGFAGTGLISARLAAARVPPTTINVYLFAVGLVAFLLYAGLTQADFRLPPSQCWWLLPLAGTLFASNYSVVRAYQAAPNVGYVKAIGVADLVLVALVVAVLAVVQGRPVALPWWKLAGIGLCVVGAVLVALEDRTSSPVPPPHAPPARPPRAAPALRGPRPAPGGAGRRPASARPCAAPVPPGFRAWRARRRRRSAADLQSSPGCRRRPAGRPHGPAPSAAGSARAPPAPAAPARGRAARRRPAAGGPPPPAGPPLAPPGGPRKRESHPHGTSVAL